MIERLITTSKVTEVDDVSMRMISAYNASGLNTDPHLKTMFTSLKDQSTKLTTAINRSKAESTLDAYDEKRDDNVRSFEYLVLGFMHHPDAAIKSAAQDVQNVFSKYGLGIIGESYSTESSLITSLLDDLKSQKMQDAIAQLPGCAETITNLTKSQKDFETVRLAYEKEKAEEGTQSNASTIKKEVIELVNNKIIIYLHAMEIVDETTYGSFVRTIAQIIADNNEVVKKRRKKEEPAEEIN